MFDRVRGGRARSRRPRVGIRGGVVQNGRLGPWPERRAPAAPPATPCAGEGRQPARQRPACPSWPQPRARVRPSAPHSPRPWRALYPRAPVLVLADDHALVASTLLPLPLPPPPPASLRSTVHAVLEGVGCACAWRWPLLRSCTRAPVPGHARYCPRRPLLVPVPIAPLFLPRRGWTCRVFLAPPPCVVRRLLSTRSCFPAIFFCSRRTRPFPSPVSPFPWATPFPFCPFLGAAPEKPFPLPGVTLRRAGVPWPPRCC